MQQAFGKGVVFMLLSALFLSTALLLIKLGSFDYPFFWLIFMRYSVSFVCLSAILLFKRRLLATIKTTHFRYHLLRGVVICASQYCLFS